MTSAATHDTAATTDTATAAAVPAPVPAPPLPQGLTCVWPAAATLGEGARWSAREDALYWVDILGHRLHRYRPADGIGTSWDFDETISAVAERRDGPGLIVTLRHGFALFDPAHPSAGVQRLHNPPEEIPGNRFNDGGCDAQGRFWGGTMDYACEAPTGAFYVYSANGDCVRHDLGFPVTNGPNWTDDGRTLFINDTARNQVWAWDFEPASGAISNQRRWLNFADGDGLPDGMTRDAEGKLWIAHWGGACVTRHDPVTGAELARVSLPTRHITNVAFGGPALRTLFITSATFGLSDAQRAAEPLAGGLFAVDAGVAGVPAHLFG